MRYRKSIVLAVALAVALPLLVAAAPPPLPTLTEITKVRAAGPGSMLVRLAQDTTFSQPKGKAVPFAYDVDGLAAVALVQADPARGERRLGVMSIWLGREWGRESQYQEAIGTEDPQEPVTLPAGRYWLHTVSDGERVNVNVHVPTATGQAVFAPTPNPRNTVRDAENQLPTHVADEGRVTNSGGLTHEFRSDGYLFGFTAVEASHVNVNPVQYCLYLNEPILPNPYLPGCPSVEFDPYFAPYGAAVVLPGERFRLTNSFGVTVLKPLTLGFGAYSLSAGVTDEWKGFRQFSLDFVPRRR